MLVITPEQCLAARAIIRWTRDELAKAAGVASATLADFEAAKRTPYDRTLRDIRTALEAAGVIFIDENGEGPGVRLRKNLTLDMFAGSGNAAVEFQRVTARDDGPVIVTDPPYPSRKK